MLEPAIKHKPVWLGHSGDAFGGDPLHDITSAALVIPPSLEWNSCVIVHSPFAKYSRIFSIALFSSLMYMLYPEKYPSAFILTIFMDEMCLVTLLVLQTL